MNNKPIINKNVVYDMMLNALYQLQDGVSIDELNVNPDMDKYPDYDIEDIIDLGSEYQDK